MRGIKFRIEADRGLQARQRFVAAPGVNQELAFEGVDPWIEWFQLAGRARLPQGFRVPSLVRAEVCVIDVRIRVIRIESRHA